MYRIIYRSGAYRDVENPGTLTTFKGVMRHLGDEPMREAVWAVINLEVVEGGDAYQALLETLDVEQSV